MKRTDVTNSKVIGVTVRRGEQNKSGIDRESLRTEKQPDNQETEAVEQSGGGLIHAYTHLMHAPKVYQICN